MAQPGFIFGGNTGISYDELQQRRKVLDAMLARQSAPQNVGEGIFAFAQGIAGGLEARGLRKAEEEGRQRSDNAFSSALSSLSGSGYSPQLSSGIEPVPVPSPVGGNVGSTMPSASSPAGGARAAAGGPVEEYASALPQSFLATVDRTEGGGDYDTLFGHSQRNGPFSNVRVSGMTVGQAIDFADPSGAYGQFVKGKVGKVATPMGRHQIVGTTLRNAAAEMGLDPSTPFNNQTQDAIAAHLARKRIASADSMGGKIAALRSEWEGLRHVPDAQMATIVADLQNGGGMPAAAPASSAPVQVASNDPSIGVAAATAPQTPVQTVAAAMPQQQAPAPSQAVQRVAQAMPQMPQAPSNSIPPEALQALQDPYLSDGQRQALQIAIQQRAAGNTALYERQMMAYEQQRDAILLEQKRQYDERVRQEGFQREDAIRREGYGREDANAATAQANADRDFAYKVEQGNKPPTSIQEYEYARAQGFQGTLADWEQQNRKAGATNVNLPGQPNIGTIPPGFQAVQDPATGTWTMSEIPGGPADKAKAAAAQEGNREISTSVVTTAAARAREALNAAGLPATGTVGGVLSALPESNAAELRRQVAVLQANAKVENLTAMRAASPTGAALGAVSDSENAMLAAKSGTLDPASPNFERDLDDYERTLLRIVHGPKVGDAIFEQTRPPRADASPAVAARSSIVPGSDAGQRWEGGVPVGGAVPAGMTPAAPVRINSPEEMQALPSGALFIAPDGSTRRRP